MLFWKESEAGTIGLFVALFPEQTERITQTARINRMSKEYEKLGDRNDLKKYCARKCLTYKYSEFKQAVKEGNVANLVLFPGAGAAVVELKDGKKAKVNLAPDHDLLDFLQRNNVDVRVAPS